MEWFIGGLEDSELADKLVRAIAGHGAFRRFKHRLSERRDLMARWQAVSNDRERGRARRWLAAEGYRPVGRSEYRSQ